MYARQHDRTLRLWVLVLVLLTGLGNGAAVLAMPAGAGQGMAVPDAHCVSGAPNSPSDDHHRNNGNGCCIGDSGICAFHCMTPVPGAFVSFGVAMLSPRPPAAAVTTLMQRTVQPPLRPPRS
ncbi:MAG: hypothetical protein WCC36_13270 [Gammaproteobacteria bacterium]